jgi:hypothetical protein
VDTAATGVENDFVETEIANLPIYAAPELPAAPPAVKFINLENPELMIFAIDETNLSAALAIRSPQRVDSQTDATAVYSPMPPADLSTMPRSRDEWASLVDGNAIDTEPDEIVSNRPLEHRDTLDTGRTGKLPVTPPVLNSQNDHPSSVSLQSLTGGAKNLLSRGWIAICGYLRATARAAALHAGLLSMKTRSIPAHEINR